MAALQRSGGHEIESETAHLKVRSTVSGRPTKLEKSRCFELTFALEF